MVEGLTATAGADGGAAAGLASSFLPQAASATADSAAAPVRNLRRVELDSMGLTSCFLIIFTPPENGKNTELKQICAMACYSCLRSSITYRERNAIAGFRHAQRHITNGSSYRPIAAKSSLS